jgi:putative FmdB family regulatory protein
MPRYEYECGCGTAVIRIFAMRDVASEVTCAVCGGEARRVFAAPQLKSASLYSEANKRGLVELEATRRTDAQVYARNWDRRLPGLT